MRKILFLLTLLVIGSASALLWLSHKAEEQSVAVTGDALIGGKFTLTDQNGKPVKDEDLRGQVLLVFFGFTHCPDICPVTVKTLSDLVDSLGDKATQVTPVFITVDPERDTPEAMKTYLANFNARIVGLTGTPEQIKQVAQLYKAYYSKSAVPAADAATPSKEEHEHEHEHDHAQMHGGDHGNYGVDHSGYIYMMGRDGKYIRIFPYNVEQQELLRALTPVLN